MEPKGYVSDATIAITGGGPKLQPICPYRVRGGEGEWRVETGEKAGMADASREAAFESAVSAASTLFATFMTW